MKNILFIVPYPPGEAPSQRFRFEQYFDLLRRNNDHFVIAPFWSVSAWRLLYKPNHVIEKTAFFILAVARRFGLLFSMRKYQFIFIHREAMPLGPPVIEFIISKIFRKRIIYDFDDAIWLPNTSAQNRLAGWLKWHGKVRSICRWSWKVSCGNGFLAEYARKFNDKVVVNPTTIDTDYHRPQPTKVKNSIPVIGWTGTHSTARYLSRLTPVLKELQKNHDFLMKIICDRRPDWDYNDFEFIPWQKDREIAQLNEIDIGVMPLEDTDWEKGKCGFKALQYMALARPAVVSAVGVNQEIIDHEKNGFLCTSQDDWIRYISMLLDSAPLRKQLGENGRQKIISRYSTASNSTRFLSLFE